MGLDAVELAIDVEDTFRIAIRDEDYEKLRTVGNLYDYILAKLAAKHAARSAVVDGQREPAVCLTSAAFCRVRSALLPVVWAPRNQIRPSTSLATLLPVRSRRKIWNEFQKALGLNVPDLDRPRWIDMAIGMLAMAIALTSFILLNLLLGGSLAIVLSIFLTYAILSTAMPMSRQLANDIPSGINTVGDLAHEVLRCNYRHLHAEYNPSPNLNVWETLRTIIVDNFHVSPESVTRETRFIEDLYVN